MNRLVRGTVLLAAIAAVWSCESDPTGGNAKTVATVSANPSVAFVPNDDSLGVIVQALNDLNQADSAQFTAANVGSGIVVTQDTTYGHIIGGGNVPTSARFYVKPASTTTFVKTSFDVSAGGQTTTIPVTIVPASLDVTFSNPTPIAGEAVTLTAPAGTHFTSTTTVTVGGGAQVISISPDSTMLTVAFGLGNIGATATVGPVVADYIPGQEFTIPVTGKVTTDTLGSYSLGVSTTTPNYGDLVTLTIPAPLKATPASVVTTLGGSNAIVSISADSSTVVFAIGPNVSGVVSIDNLVLDGAPDLGPYTLATTDVVTSPALTSLTANFSTSSPNVNDLVTVTAAGFKFFPTTTVSFNGDVQSTTSVSADSSTLTFRTHKAGASGTVSITGAALSSLPAVQLGSLTATGASLTVGSSIATLAGTADTSTAPLVTMPTASGSTGGVIDDNVTFAPNADCTNILGGPCLIYKMVLTQSVTFAASVTWNNLSDQGLYFFDDQLNVVGTTACDAHGQGAGGQPETCSTTLGPGTFYLFLDSFAPFYGPPNNVDPTMIQIDFSIP